MSKLSRRVKKDTDTDAMKEECRSMLEGESLHDLVEYMINSRTATLKGILQMYMRESGKRTSTPDVASTLGMDRDESLLMAEVEEYVTLQTEAWWGEHKASDGYTFNDMLKDTATDVMAFYEARDLEITHDDALALVATLAGG